MFILLCLMYLSVFVYTCLQAIVHMWRFGDNCRCSSFHWVGPGDQTQVDRLAASNFTTELCCWPKALCYFYSIVSTRQSFVSAEIFKSSFGYSFLGFILNLLN